MLNEGVISCPYSLFKLCLYRNDPVRVVLALEFYVIFFVCFKEVVRVKRVDDFLLAFEVFDFFAISGSH